MLYKNSIKLLTSTFGLVWKQLVYSLICLAVGLLSAYLFLQPVIDCLTNAGWIKEFTSIFETVYTNFSEIGVVVENTFVHFLKIITDNFASLWGYFLGMFIVSVMIPSIMLNYSQYVLCKVSGDQMSSLMQSGYTKTVFESFKQGFLYALAKFIYDLPFAIVKFGIICIYVKFATNLVMTIVLLSLMSLLFLAIEALRITIFSCFAGYTIDTGKNPFKGFFKSVGVLGKSFGRVFSNAVAVILTIIFINSFIGLFTVLSGLLITVPASMVFCAIFYQVVFYSVQGKRYYLTNTLIVNPIN